MMPSERSLTKLGVMCTVEEWRPNKGLVSCMVTIMFFNTIIFICRHYHVLAVDAVWDACWPCKRVEVLNMMPSERSLTKLGVMCTVEEWRPTKGGIWYGNYNVFQYDIEFKAIYR
ncbi:hypothetical protein QE152_g21527 [Popillia japonica]|uniref:Uncharacterized protein n=1 Tax=Popillia japonica TaxID=7064 RepID=A0AAW1KLW1_POPJA